MSSREWINRAQNTSDLVTCFCRNPGVDSGSRLSALKIKCDDGVTGLTIYILLPMTEAMGYFSSFEVNGIGLWGAPFERELTRAESFHTKRWSNTKTKSPAHVFSTALHSARPGLFGRKHIQGAGRTDGSRLRERAGSVNYPDLFRPKELALAKRVVNLHDQEDGYESDHGRQDPS